MYLRHGDIAWELAPGGRPIGGGVGANGGAAGAAAPVPPQQYGPMRPDIHASMTLAEQPATRFGSAGSTAAPLSSSSSSSSSSPTSPPSQRLDLAVGLQAVDATPIDGEPAPVAPAFVPPRPLLPVITLHGVEIHAIDEAATIAHVLGEIDARRGGFAVTPNLDHLRRYGDDVNFGALVAEADLVLADGMPLVWAARLQGTPLPGRVAGSDLIWSLSAAAAARGRTLFMLGGAPGTAEGAARKLVERNPNLKIVGTHCPPLGFDKDEKQVAQIVEMLRAAKPDIVFVALGSPKQEYLIDRIRRTLPRAWWIGVGISFSFVCGEVKRAPRWMQHTGLEWTHRLFQEPKRLFRRYIVVGLPFATALMTRAALHRVATKLRAVDPRPSMRQSMRYWSHGRNSAGRYRAANGNGHANGNGNGNGYAQQSAGTRFGEPDLPLTLSAAALGHTGSNGNGHGNGDGDGNGHGAATIDLVTSATSQSFIRAADPVGPMITVTARHDAAATSAVKALSRLRALVLLGGSVRQTQLSLEPGRSILDLPVDDRGSILNLWLSHAAELADYAGIENLPVQALVSRNSPEPNSAAARYRNSFRVLRDQSEFRGTGGVLRDLAMDYDGDDLVLVANAAQLLLDPLSVIAAALDHKRGDVALISHQDGTPSGVMLVRCKTLRLIPANGFVDMKEQALPMISQQFDVRVMHVRRPSGLPIRTLADYIGALRHYHRRRVGRPAMVDPLAEDWQPAFSIIEDGATVHPDSHVHDSVVLKGAVVEPGASIVRSLVCPGAVARAKTTNVDTYVGCRTK